MLERMRLPRSHASQRKYESTKIREETWWLKLIKVAGSNPRTSSKNFHVFDCSPKRERGMHSSLGWFCVMQCWPSGRSSWKLGETPRIIIHFVIAVAMVQLIYWHQLYWCRCSRQAMHARSHNLRGQLSESLRKASMKQIASPRLSSLYNEDDDDQFDSIKHEHTLIGFDWSVCLHVVGTLLERVLPDGCHDPSSLFPSTAIVTWPSHWTTDWTQKMFEAMVEDNGRLAWIELTALLRLDTM